MSSSCLALENNIECRRKTDVIFYLEQKKKKIYSKSGGGCENPRYLGKTLPSFFARIISTTFAVATPKLHTQCKVLWKFFAKCNFYKSLGWPWVICLWLFCPFALALGPFPLALGPFPLALFLWLLALLPFCLGSWPFSFGPFALTLGPFPLALLPWLLALLPWPFCLGSWPFCLGSWPFSLGLWPLTFGPWPRLVFLLV